MDLLGSILGSMSGPPTLSEKEKEKRKKEQEMMKKAEEKQKMATKKFREGIEAKVDKFIKNHPDPCPEGLQFSPMEKYERSVVHDVVEVAGLVAYSFGEDGVDRHVVAWKREDAPSEDELNRLRKGLDKDAWEALKAQEAQEALEAAEIKKNSRKKFIPTKGNYQEKYEHLIGKEAALEAARKTELNKSYGMVSAEMKKDRRTVEDIQAELRAKKRRKQEEETETQSSKCNRNETDIS